VVSGEKQKISKPCKAANSLQQLQIAHFSLTDRCFFVSQLVLVSADIFSWTCAKILSIYSNQP
jgi:hypothetical protein